MEQQSRAWTLGHLKTLHAVFKTRFIDTFQSGRVLSSSQTTVKIDHYDMMILHKIQELQFDADVYIRRRFDGWVTAHRTIHPLMGNLGAPKAELDTVYAGIEKSRMQAVRTAFEAVAAERTRLRRAEGPTPDFLEAPSLRMDREFAHKELQKEIEEPPAMGMEEWVRLQSDEKVERFGFVVYRLAYQETDQEWDIFKWKLETGLESGLAGLVGADGIKAKATLHWVDGRKHKIAEDDIAAARRSVHSIPSLVVPNTNHDYFSAHNHNPGTSTPAASPPVSPQACSSPSLRSPCTLTPPPRPPSAKATAAASCAPWTPPLTPRTRRTGLTRGPSRCWTSSSGRICSRCTLRPRASS